MELRRSLSLLAALALLGAACGGSDSEGSSNGGATTSTGANGGDNGGGAAGGGELTWDIDAALDADPNCDDPVTGDPFRIGYAADFSELGGFADVPASEAATVFAQMINCSGGIDGVPVEVIVEDISGDPEITQRAAQSLLDSGVSGILGPPFPDFGFPLLQVTQGSVPVLFTGSTDPSLIDAASNSYIVSMDDRLQATAAAEFALDQGWTTAVTFSAPGPYFGFNPEVFTEVFEAGGGTVIDDYGFVPADDVDFSAQVNSIANGDAPDVIYSAMLAHQIAALLSQLDGAGVETNFIGTDAVEATGGYFTSGLDGVYHTTHAFGPDNERYGKLSAAIEAVTGSESESPTFSALAVDGIAVFIHAYQLTGSSDAATIGEAIPNLSNVDGVTAVLSYSGTANPSKPVFIHQIVDGAPTLAATVE